VNCITLCSAPDRLLLLVYKRRQQKRLLQQHANNHKDAYLLPLLIRYSDRTITASLKLGRIMTEDNDQEFDIDALLNEDSMVNRSDAGLAMEPPALDPVKKLRPTKSSNLDRLTARATHAGKNLRDTLGSVRDMQDLLAEDHELCTQLTLDIDNWQHSLGQLAIVLDVENDSSIAMTPSTLPEEDNQLKEDLERVFAGAIVESDAPADPVNTKDVNAKDVNEWEKLVAEKEAQIRDLESRLAQDNSAAEESGTEDNQSECADPYVNRLIVTSDDHGNLKFPLDRNIMTIGRDAQSDIHIRSRFISRFHARVISDRDGAIIEDLGSRNGITVNAQRVRRQQLRSGDLIDLGRTQLKYIDLSEGASGEGQA
jgi:hypothetical protein